MRYVWAAIPVMFLFLCGGPKIARADEEAVYRINCGAGTEYVDNNNVKWLPDQVLGPGKTWGAVGGGTIIREKALRIHDEIRGETRRRIAKLPLPQEVTSLVVLVNIMSGQRGSRAMQI